MFAEKEFRNTKSVASLQQVVEDVTRQCTLQSVDFNESRRCPDGIEFSESYYWTTRKNQLLTPCKKLLMKEEFISFREKHEFISWKQKLVSWLILFGLLGVLSLVIAGCGSTDTARLDSGRGSHKSIGHQLDNTIVSVISNAAVGGTAGSEINNQMDKQALELRSTLKDARVMRFGEGILVTIDSRLLFEEDSYALQSTRGTLKDLARILQKHGYTNVIIEGHTDNVGEEIYNQSLSENRAHEIEKYFVRKGIKDTRMKTRGYGERQPIATNDTEAGRQQNCRIEIGLYANDQLRQSTSKADETYTALKQ